MSSKTFISYAGEDKQFVEAFTTKLTDKGVEVWFAPWEINPGDDLVDKLFNQGLKGADVLVIILSKASVNKPWVKEELNYGFVKRIEKSCKIIPVIIEDCEIPECLSSTVHIKIDDRNNYEDKIEEIVNGVFGHYNRAPLGVPPAYIQLTVDLLPDLNKSETIVLTKMCELALSEGSGFYQGLDSDRTKQAEFFGLPEDEVYDSLEILKRHGYINLSKSTRGVGGLQILPYGFDIFARNRIPDYPSTVDQVAHYLVNHGPADSTTIAKELVVSHTLVLHIFNHLEGKGFLRQSKLNGASLYAHDISPELKRILTQKA
jgi:hypothetical protein